MKKILIFGILIISNLVASAQNNSSLFGLTYGGAISYQKINSKSFLLFTEDYKSVNANNMPILKYNGGLGASLDANPILFGRICFPANIFINTSSASLTFPATQESRNFLFRATGLSLGVGVSPTKITPNAKFYCIVDVGIALNGSRIKSTGKFNTTNTLLDGNFKNNGGNFHIGANANFKVNKNFFVARIQYFFPTFSPSEMTDNTSTTYTKLLPLDITNYASNPVNYFYKSVSDDFSFVRISIGYNIMRKNN